MIESHELNEQNFLLSSPSSKKEFTVSLQDLSTGHATNKKKKTFSNSVKQNPFLPRPDFSTIEKKERTLVFKETGSYKKPMATFPKSPLKSRKRSFCTPNNNYQKIEMFPEDNISRVSACRKLNFFEPPTQEEENNISNNTNFQNQSGFKLNSLFNNDKQINFFLCLKEDEDLMNVDEHQDESKDSIFEKEYIVLKKINNQNSIYNELYKCLHKQTNKIYTIKKTKSKSILTKQYLDVLDKLTQSSLNNESSICKQYVLSPIKYWIEHNYQINKKSLITLYPYYKQGDLMDYLSYINNSQNILLQNESFYWDMIFNMLCALYYLHVEMNIIHLNINPLNFLVNNSNQIILTGFSLSRDKNYLINNEDDIIEGDFAYIAPEILNDKHNIGFKSDIFSLGLSLLEILAKVDLPQNGEMWKSIRMKDNYKIVDELYIKWDIKSESLLNLIKRMVCVNVCNRPSTEELLNEFIELKHRMVNLQNKLNMMNVDDSNDDMVMVIDEEDEELNVKRTNSLKQVLLNSK